MAFMTVRSLFKKATEYALASVGTVRKHKNYQQMLISENYKIEFRGFA